jgi:ferredoxin-NADP reductase
MSFDAKAKITDIRCLLGDVSDLTLEAAMPGFFARATPGAHLDIRLPNGGARQYSLYDWSENGNIARLAVKCEGQGRGGSLWICNDLSVGHILDVSSPRNHFHLDEGADQYVLIAGGIGVTPIYAMARRLHRLRKPFRFHYMTRSPETAAFANHLSSSPFAEAVHTDYSDLNGLPNFDRVLADVTAKAEVYVCGPEPMLQAVTAAASRRGIEVKYERFAPIQSVSTANGSFTVLLKQSDRELFVPADKTLLEVLTANGVRVDKACTEGVCGSCLTRVLDGSVDHRDSILDESERARNDQICVCVSRAISSRLVLDL